MKYVLSLVLTFILTACNPYGQGIVGEYKSTIKPEYHLIVKDNGTCTLTLGQKTGEGHWGVGTVGSKSANMYNFIFQDIAFEAVYAHDTLQVETWSQKGAANNDIRFVKVD